MCSAALVKKVAECHTIITNVAVTTRISINSFRKDLIMKFTFIFEKRIKFVY